MTHVLTRGAHAERLLALMIGRCMHLEELVLVCNVFQLSRACISVLSATQTASLTLGKPSTLCLKKFVNRVVARRLKGEEQIQWTVASTMTLDL